MPGILLRKRALAIPRVLSRSSVLILEFLCAFGKWYTPGLGFRTKIQGIWGKYVDADGNDATNEGNGNKYWVANEQVMFNLSNLLYGYNENRVWNLIPFAGAGIGRSMTHNAYALDYSAGIQSSWKIGRRPTFLLRSV